MMGRQEPGQERLFYSFRLEDQVPPNHLVRKLDALLDFETIRAQLAPYYSEIGRPSVDRSERTETSGSVGPAGRSNRSPLRGGFIRTTSSV